MMLRRASDHRFEQCRRFGNDRSETHEIVHAQTLLTETANRDRGTVERERFDDGVHARTVCETRIDHRRGFVACAGRAGAMMRSMIVRR